MDTEGEPAGLPVVLFDDPAGWRRWLDRNHESSRGLWLRLAKKSSELVSMSYAEAVEVALCYGWIDGQKKAFDQDSWLQKFTPRGRRSLWSRVNRDKVNVLIEQGRMRPAGLRAVELAKQDGRWAAAYEPQSRATVPDDLAAALQTNPRAAAFFATLDSANRYAIIWRLRTAQRPETRARNLAKFVAMLERGEKLHP